MTFLIMGFLQSRGFCLKTYYLTINAVCDLEGNRYEVSNDKWFIFFNKFNQTLMIEKQYVLKGILYFSKKLFFYGLKLQ